MATKWDISANWLYADWTSNAGALIGYLLPAVKGAADERVAFWNRSASGSFPEPQIFPDLDGKALLADGGGATKNMRKIENSLYPEPCVETDSLQDDGETWAGTNPNNLFLSELLDVLGYSPDTQLLSSIATNNGSVQGAWLMSWFKQWFEVADYPKYYFRTLNTAANGPITNLEVRRLQILTQYDYEDSPANFLSASCDKTTGKSPTSTTDIYVANDLNETAPFSTPAEVRQYTQDQFDAEWPNTGWQAVSIFSGEGDFARIGAEWREDILRSSSSFPPETIRFDYKIMHSVWRFKVNQDYRPASGQRYDSDNYAYYYPTTLTSNTPDVFFAFGTGDTENEVFFATLTPDANGWHYLGFNTALSYAGGPANLVIPTSAPSLQTVTNLVSNMYQLPRPGSGTKGVYIRPNKTDGTAWEYFTP